MASDSLQKRYIQKFPSKLAEPKVVIVWSSLHSDSSKNADILTDMESIFASKNVRFDTLDINDVENSILLSMFIEAEHISKGEYPQIFVYEDKDADYICLGAEISGMVKDGTFDDEFADCIGIDVKNAEEEDEKYDDKEFETQALRIVESEEFKSKPIGKYTSEELAAHVVNLTFNDLTKSMIKYKVDGPMLRKVKRPSDIKKLLHVDDDTANGFFELLQEEKEKETAKKGGFKFSETSDKWLSKPMMRWNLREVKGWVKSFIKNEKEINILFQSIDKNNCNGRRLIELDELSDLCDELEIDQSSGIVQKLLSAIKIQMDKQFDSDEKKDENTEKIVYRTRNFRKFDWIIVSKQEDCIMKYNDDDDIDRAEMGCGHAIAADTLFYYIRSSFTDNHKIADITCPVPTCQKKWDWDLCVMVSDMSNEEKTKYSKIRFKRRHTNLTECPNCGKMVHRSKNLQQFRVRCVCSSKEFCFNCSLSWRRDESKTVCGNSSCSTVTDLNETLRKTNWNKSEIDNMAHRKDGKTVPKIRACPRCLTLVIHKVDCKHMICKGCDKKFCFVCLGLYDYKEKKWECVTGNSYSKQCPVAEIQKFG
eukprot:500345_1